MHAWWQLRQSRQSSITGQRCLLAMGKSSRTHLNPQYLFPYHSPGCTQGRAMVINHPMLGKRVANRDKVEVDLGQRHWLLFMVCSNVSISWNA